MALTPDRQAFLERLDAEVAGEPACREGGPWRAICVLEPDHEGRTHEGYGCDVWGPRYVAWTNKERATSAQSARGARDDGGR